MKDRDPSRFSVLEMRDTIGLKNEAWVNGF
jgi:hypothetical protein